MGVLHVKDNEICFSRRGETVRISAWGPDCLRFQSSANGQIIDQDWNLLPQAAVSCQLSQDAETATLVNGSLKVQVKQNGQVIYFKHGKEIITEQSEFAFNFRFRQYRHLHGNSFRGIVTFKADPDEHFYGMGQDPHGRLDLKGTTSDLMHKNTKTSIPFVYSSKGYGFLWNNPSVGRAEFGHNRTQWESNSCQQLDYLVIGGDSPRETMRLYAQLTGFSPRLPAWASGFWQCKLRYESQEDLLAVARRYHAEGTPLSVIVIDYFHWTQQGDWQFDPKYWPDPQAMVQELNAMGIKLMVSVWPTIHPQSVNFKEMDEKNLMIQSENGQFGLFDFYGQLSYLDATNPQTRAFVWDKIKANYYSCGIKTFWLDEAEPEIYPNHYDNMRLHAGNGEETGLLYPYHYAQLFHDGLKKEGETDVLSLIRAAWIGNQRFGSLLWSGDVPSTFESLAQQVKVGLNVAMCGIPWWSSDIGGFHGADIKSAYFQELIVRWFQFGVFCPVTRLHGARLRPADHVKRYPEVLECSGGDNEIWSFGEAAYPVLKGLIELRERLRPYVHRHMEIASSTGTPVMRPIFFDFPDDPVCYGLDDQYLFGDDILFAPVVNQGQTSRPVYLPAGVTWINCNDRSEHQGPGFVHCTAALDQLIAFVRKGSAVLEAFA